MHCHDSIWWIFPMVCFGMMLLFSFGVGRGRRRRWCFPPRNRSDTSERIEELEAEIENLKQNLTQERRSEKMENGSV